MRLTDLIQRISGQAGGMTGASPTQAGLNILLAQQMAGAGPQFRSQLPSVQDILPGMSLLQPGVELPAAGGLPAKIQANAGPMMQPGVGLPAAGAVPGKIDMTPMPQYVDDTVNQNYLTEVGANTSAKLQPGIQELLAVAGRNGLSMPTMMSPEEEALYLNPQVNTLQPASSGPLQQAPMQNKSTLGQFRQNWNWNQWTPYGRWR